jgi:hypothetical protein
VVKETTMIDTKTHAREIGRHLRNGKFELSEGGVLIQGGMNALLNGAFIDTLNGGDAQLSPNLVVNQGLIHILNVIFAGATPITGWHIGLFSNDVEPQASWTGANIVANAAEVTGYSISGGNTTNRPVFTTSTVTAPSIGNSGAQANFLFDDEGPYTARGAFLIQPSAKGSTTGVLMAATRFATDRAGLANPDQLGVQYVITAADAG